MITLLQIPIKDITLIRITHTGLIRVETDKLIFRCTSIQTYSTDELLISSIDSLLINIDEAHKKKILIEQENLMYSTYHKDIEDMISILELKEANRIIDTHNADCD